MGRLRSSSTRWTAAASSQWSSSPGATPTRTRARSASGCPTRASPPGTTRCSARSRCRTRSSRTSCSSARTAGRRTTSPTRSRTWTTRSHMSSAAGTMSPTPRSSSGSWPPSAHEPPVYAHVPDVLGDDGKKLSKRHGATSVDEFRAAGYLPQALMNFLALLGWAPDGETTIMPPDELIERFTLERVGASPATLDYQKLDWMNGVYLRALDADAYADALVAYLGEQGFAWPEERIRAAAPLVQEKIERLGAVPRVRRLLLRAAERLRPCGSRCRRPRGRGGDARRPGALHCRDDRAGPPRARGAASGRSLARRSSRSASRSPARPSRRACSRASSCSAATRRSPGSDRRGRPRPDPPMGGGRAVRRRRARCPPPTAAR